MYIIKQYNEVLGIYPKYCKDKTKGYTYICIENIDDLILFIKYYIKDIQSHTLDIMEIENINTVLDTTKL